jgi:hypothetical protein
MPRETDHTPSVRQDGFGARSLTVEPPHGRVERLDLTPALSSVASEQAIRVRAAYHNTLDNSPVGRVIRVARTGDALSVFSLAPDGVPISELLAGLEFKTVSLSGEELLELASSIVTALAAMHERMPGIAHGALTPEHIVLRRDGSTVLTGAVYAEALQALQRNREHLWRDFGLALPTAASLPRFDQRGDVTQMAAVVLSITLRRPLRRDEYPKRAHDIALSATVTGNPATDSKLRTWLQDALQLHGRVTFGSGVDAARAFSDVLPPVTERTLEALALQTAIRQLCSEPETSVETLPHQRAS